MRYDLELLAQLNRDAMCQHVARLKGMIDYAQTTAHQPDTLLPIRSTYVIVVEQSGMVRCTPS
jgi:hypothetical protein